VASSTTQDQISDRDHSITSDRDHSITRGGRLALRLPDTLAAVGLARRAVDLVGFSVSPDVREDAQLIVSELVANGLEHGQGGVTISLAVSERGRLSGEVVDDGHGFEAPAPGFPCSTPNGRGLAIVGALTERWGIEKGTTRVWFAMPSEAARVVESR
jgi:anti-sigma regulatory factor (Ser/Thr protein kinase)